MDKEKKDKVKGICGTLLFHALLLFLLSLPFMGLSYEDPPTREGGGSIAMNLIKQDPPSPKEVSEEVHEESEMIEDKDIITSEEGELEVTDNINNEIPDDNFSQTDMISKSLSKSMAIKNGQHLSVSQMDFIVNGLFACKEPNTSPFNKRTYITLTKEDLDNKFN